MNYSGRFLQWYASCAMVAVAMALSACASSGSSGAAGTTPELAGTHWVLTRIDGNAPLSGEPLNADFSADGRINGHSGCNSFSGPFIQTGATVQIGELLSTRRACVDADRQRQEGRMLAILQGSSTARLDHGQLNLRGNTGTLVFASGTVADSSYAYSRHVQFDCEGTGLMVHFDSGRADLTWNDGHDVLDQKPAASGLWYESPSSSLRGKGDLTWSQNGRTRVCRELK